MAQSVRVGIIGGGWPGAAHAKGYAEAGGFKIVAVADLIPSRRGKIIADHPGAKEYAQGEELLKDENVDAVSVCLPNHLHAPMTVAALRAGKHVLCEKPPAVNVAQARQMERAAAKASKVLLYAVQRRFGSHELAAKQAIAKGYMGDVYHARASWMRTRGIPVGTGWFTDKCRSGGGALIDIGIHVLDLAWHLLGQPKPTSAYGFTHSHFHSTLPEGVTCDVDDAAFAMIRFEGGKSLELATSWAINQPPQQQGMICRVYGTQGALEVYTPQGATLFRNFNNKGEPKSNPLKGPKIQGHPALMRHFRECITNNTPPSIGPAEGVTLMQMIEAIYQSSESGKSVSIK